MLEDEESKKVYLNYLNWVISGDLKYIDALEPIIAAEVFPILREQTMNLRNSIPKDHKIIFYGAGEVGKKVLPFWKEDERFIGFCSRTKEKQERGYCNYPVISPEELFLRKDLSVVISVDLEKPKSEIKQLLYENQYPSELIFEAPTVYSCASQAQYFSPGFIVYGKNEVFLDVGCLDLGSSLEFRKHCKSIKKIYAFEPDPQNYQICLLKKQEYSFSEVELLPYGTWSERATLHFNATHDCNSRISEDGCVHVQVMPIDEVIDPADKVTMVKMDIEGAELESLKGAKTIIQRDRPKLAICIYHKPKDIIEIPMYIKKIVPEYKLYMRHYSSGPCETVLYAMMPK